MIVSGLGQTYMTLSEVAYLPDNDEVQLLILLAEKFIWPQEDKTFVPLDGEHSSLLAPRLEIKGSGNLWHVYGWPIITAATGRGLVKGGSSVPYWMIQIYLYRG